MPSGRTHLKIEMTVFAGCTVLGLYLVKLNFIAIVHLASFLGSYLFASLFLTPDLDLKQSIAFKRWGIARILWLPYAHLFRHRALSHHILFGPLTRIVYAVLILSLVVSALTHMTSLRIQLHAPGWAVLVSIVAGVYLPNQIHTLADILWSIKRRC